MDRVSSDDGNEKKKTREEIRRDLIRKRKREKLRRMILQRGDGYLRDPEGFLRNPNTSEYENDNDGAIDTPDEHSSASEFPDSNSQIILPDEDTSDRFKIFRYFFKYLKKCTFLVILLLSFCSVSFRFHILLCILLFESFHIICVLGSYRNWFSVWIYIEILKNICFNISLFFVSFVYFTKILHVT